MTTNFERLTQPAPPQSDQLPADKHPDRDDSGLSNKSHEVVGSDAPPWSGAQADTLEVIDFGHCRVELVGGLRHAIATHRDRRWQQFLDYWLTLAHRQQSLPSRQSIDPLQMPRGLIANLFLTEVVYETGNQPRFRFRLLGQEITDRENTRPGQYVHELGGNYGSQSLEPHYLDCLNHRIWLRRTSLNWADKYKSLMLYDVLLLPLARDGRSVDAMIGLVIYDN
jgi:hypothetical protein